MWPTAAGKVVVRCVHIILSRSLDAKERRNVGDLLAKDTIFLVFLGPHIVHMEVPRLGVESEPQLLTYATATAIQDPSHICDLHHSSRQRWILKPLSEARDQTCTQWEL